MIRKTVMPKLTLGCNTDLLPPMLVQPLHITLFDVQGHLTHFSPMSFGFLTFSGGIEMKYSTIIGKL